MRTATIALALTLTACAVSPQPPLELVQAKRTVDAKLEYEYYRSHYVGQELVEAKPTGLAPYERNCVGFAKEYQKALGGRGYIHTFRPNGGEWHAVLNVDGWQLDVMRRAPVWVGQGY